MDKLKGDIQIYEKNGTRVVHEYFSSIHQLLNCLDSRRNNEIMKSNDSSTESGREEWYGTSSYKEAKELLTCGYTDILDRLKLGMHKAVKALSDLDFSKSFIVEDVQGAAPVIPNYIQNLPKTMCYRKSTVRKVKTVSIIYSPCENCDSDPDKFIDAGVAVLSAIRAMEKSGISIKLDCMFSDAYSENEAIVGTVRVKNFGDRLDLQKLCFPLANAAMERRIGFKFIETAPDMEASGFSYAYGKTPSLSTLESFFKIPKDTVLINMKLINEDLDNDPKKVIEYINKKITNK